MSMFGCTNDCLTVILDFCCLTSLTNGGTAKSIKTYRRRHTAITATDDGVGLLFIGVKGTADIDRPFKKTSIGIQHFFNATQICVHT